MGALLHQGDARFPILNQTARGTAREAQSETLHTMKTRTVKLSALKLDPKIQEIRPLNSIFVSRYRQSMRNGDVFPPYLVDDDLMIVGGNHRHAAESAEFGPDRDVKIIVRHYANEAERIEDAVRDNARHGLALDGISRKRAVIALVELGRSAEDIGRVLGVPARRIEDLAGLSVIVVGGGREKAEPIKRRKRTTLQP